MAPRKRGNDAISEQELIDMIARAKSRSGDRGPYTGRPDAPDLPSEQDYRMLDQNPTDSGYSNFVNRFGFESLNPDAGKPNYVPTPRPREPMNDYNNPMGPRKMGIDEIINQGADIPDRQIDAEQGAREDYFKRLEGIHERMRHEKRG